jgi:RNase H-like domain found in reverse transcriptase/Reverse transcriptase (RNA-dependent DNA polymerase)/Integrase zinc binding domain
LHGHSQIDQYIEAPLLKRFGIFEKIKFFVVPILRQYDGILGHPAIKKLNLVLDFKNNLVSNGKVTFKFFNKLENDTFIANLETHQENKIFNLLEKYKNIQLKPDEKLTFNTQIEAEIKTLTTDPIYANYPIPFAMRPIAEKLIQTMLENNIIRHSKSPYNSPIKIVEKKSDTSEKKYRLTVNFKKLNTQVVSDKYPVPNIEDILAQLGGKSFFTTLDLVQGFFQIPLKEEDRKKTAFSGPTGKYEFLRLPMGLKNSPAAFQRMLDDIFREDIGKRCFVYVDDIICFSNSFEQHLIDLDIILNKLDQANLKIQSEKCEWAKSELKYLGFVISSDGVKPDRSKLEIIEKIPFPENLKQLKSFLGMVNQYRKFIRDCSKILKPLNELTNIGGFISKNQSSQIKIEPNSEAIESFLKIKKCLMSADVLAFPDMNSPYYLTTDASNVAIGAVLTQKFERSQKPIQFLSRTLSKTEQKYSTIEKELLAIVWATDHLRNYLFGNKVIIITDHKPLTYALKNNNNNDKLIRWMARLEEFDHEIIYKPGKDNKVADFFSRIEINTLSSGITQHSAPSDNHNLVDISLRPLNSFRNQIIFKKANQNFESSEVLFYNYKRHTINVTRPSDKFYLEIFKKYIDLRKENGIFAPENLIQGIQKVLKNNIYLKRNIIFTQNFLKDVTEENEQLSLIKSVHERAHRGIQENYAQIKKEFFWPSLLGSIKKFISSCSVCKINKYDRKPNQNANESTPIPSAPGEIIHIDIFQIFKQNFLSSVCKLTKYVSLVPIKTKSTEDVKFAIMDLIFKYRKPKTVVLDNEPSFQSHVIQNFFRNLDINLHFIPAGHSESNGQIERVHSTLAEIIRCKNKEWADYTPNQKIQIAADLYNNSLHSVTNFKPADLFFAATSATNLEEIIREKNDLFKLIQEKIKEKQAKDLSKNKNTFKTYQTDQKIFVKNKQIKAKTKEKYFAEVVEEDLNTKVKTKSGKLIHKSNIRN